jgi:heme A synthase
MFFHTYYISYVLAGLVVIGVWRRSSAERKIRQQANLLFLSIVAALLLGA